MEQLLSAAPAARSNETALDSVQFGDDIRHLITAPTENSSSFTALLGLPPNQAMELLHSPPDSTFKTSPDGPKLYQPPHHFNADLLTFPANAALNISPETNSNSRAKLLQKTVKGEPADTVSYLINSSQPLASDSTVVDNQRPGAKRKEREKKGRSFSKKSKCDKSEDGEKLPFVHVRARRGQATDNHSLAERARREKINARMKLLQELVPGCSKISGTALVLDEIINHVQSLQRQVEVLSMELSAVNPRIDFNMDSMMAVASGSLMDSNFPAVMMPIMWPEIQENGSRQQYQQQWNSDAVHQPTWGKEDGHSNFMSRENSLLSYVSSANSASLNSNELKMEL